MAERSSDRIDAARRGDISAARGGLESFREYLMLVASQEIGSGLATKAGASDLVQETFLAAQRGIAGFRGSTLAEWRGWLEAILTNQLANLRRSYLDTQKRRGLKSRGRPNAWRGIDVLADTPTSPSRHLRCQERDQAIEEALLRLPDHYRQVVLAGITTTD